jgi:uncharacterized protein (TIGR02246 family)
MGRRPARGDDGVTARAASDAITALLAEADSAFAAGEAERYAALFADDARLLLLHREEIIGAPAILAHWRATMPRFDLSAWEPRLVLAEEHDDRAYVHTTYTERLLTRETGERTLVRGRLIYFLRREPRHGWRIGLLMNSHSHPMEPIL